MTSRGASVTSIRSWRHWFNRWYRQVLTTVPAARSSSRWTLSSTSYREWLTTPLLYLQTPVCWRQSRWRLTWDSLTTCCPSPTTRVIETAQESYCLLWSVQESRWQPIRRPAAWFCSPMTTQEQRELRGQHRDRSQVGPHRWRRTTAERRPLRVSWCRWQNKSAMRSTAFWSSSTRVLKAWMKKETLISPKYV